ncbi:MULTISPECIES: hypothetical protein [unclassified Pseudonocardia]|uniref:hypothetical protein n=1 Tax=unclassified Pseudonocardia TaxID=2619320 RepID=UPI00094B5DB2|nr:MULTISPECIES: hypothetical protein [unclassified Pseudonocardia]NWJ69596.1 hypothetical protein [Pseudonocardia pini]NWJ69616.1 hypothetical protein [Pseudonocardia pini]OLL89491.1 hypothetical protein Ae331Ps2_6253c [Pseudonocardia sp. Ae331_Ps2]OLM08342.1 hypothetical protein Ae505Ps2_6196c [Pseudonocardia sp. Ae505_Ps2]
MRSTLAKIKAAAAAFVAAALVTAYVPAVADVLVLALVASWAVIGAVLLAPAAGLLRPHMPALRGHVLRAARAAGPWLSPRLALARLLRPRALTRPGSPLLTMHSTRWH